MTTQVQLEIFEGPLDLLLHLIKKNEVSITDIPIATITEQYLATLEVMQTLNLDVAGEFLVMAATLVHIKSRMLLPPTDEEEDEEEGADPRAELVRRLLEYQRFKDAADQLEQRELLTRDVFVRSPVRMKDIPAPGFREVPVFELLTALKRVLDRLPKDVVHEVMLDVKTGMEVVVTFLAMLELVKVRAIRIFQEESTGPIQLEAAAGIEEVPVVGMQDTEEDQHGT